MTDLEIAKKYGVPTPETSKKLDWKSETVLKWFDNKLCVYENCSPRHILRCIKTSRIICNMSFPEIGSPDPQMQEIAALLPEIKITDKAVYIKGDALFFETIEENHFAEALAKLYIKYKNK